MSSTSPYHTVPDSSAMHTLEPVHEYEADPFYIQVMSHAQGTHVQHMETSDSRSECSEAEDKVYMSLSGERKYPLRQTMSPDPDRATESIDIRSWRDRHPKHWRTQDIINWIYYVCARSDKVDRYNVRAEKFNKLLGEQLCQMTKDEFIDLDPICGANLHECFVTLLKSAQFKPPDVIDMCQMEDCVHAPQSLPLTGIPLSNNSAMWSSTIPPEESDHEMDLSTCSVTGLEADTPRYSELDAVSPGTPGIAVIGGKHYDFISDDGFEEIHCTESGYGSAGSSCTSPGAATPPIPPPAHSHHTSIHHPSLYMTQPYIHQDLHSFPRPAHASLPTTPAMYSGYQQQAPPTVQKHRGRPKHDKPTGATRGRKLGQTTKGNHLWEFIRDTINDQRYNPEYIKWENKEQGIFRIVNSAEIAKMWGRTKNNSTMTYEKFSRAMRFCRTQGFFAELPKEGNYPKKLCFRFGAKATNWAH